MNGHHLILGTLDDFITGEPLNDTLDERYRQKLARILVEQKGYLKSEITPRRDLFIRAGGKCAIIKVDYCVTLNQRICMVLKYGPGSIVTRRRPSIAASRLVAPYQVPVVVVTNGETAEILDGGSGKVAATGLEAIPSKSMLLKQTANNAFVAISGERAEMEARILFAFEVDGSCPCDDTVCRL
jgi:hypothetical protein